jgi:hypothetical protein
MPRDVAQCVTGTTGRNMLSGVSHAGVLWSTHGVLAWVRPRRARVRASLLCAVQAALRGRARPPKRSLAHAGVPPLSCGTMGYSPRTYYTGYYTVLQEHCVSRTGVCRGVGVYTCHTAAGGALHHFGASVCASRVLTAVLTAAVRSSYGMHVRRVCTNPPTRAPTFPGGACQAHLMPPYIYVCIQGYSKRTPSVRVLRSPPSTAYCGEALYPVLRAHRVLAGYSKGTQRELTGYSKEGTQKEDSKKGTHSSGEGASGACGSSRGESVGSARQRVCGALSARVGWGHVSGTHRVLSGYSPAYPYGTHGLQYGQRIGRGGAVWAQAARKRTFMCVESVPDPPGYCTVLAGGMCVLQGL